MRPLRPRGPAAPIRSLHARLCAEGVVCRTWHSGRLLAVASEVLEAHPLLVCRPPGQPFLRLVQPTGLRCPPGREEPLLAFLHSVNDGLQVGDFVLFRGRVYLDALAALGPGDAVDCAEFERTAVAVLCAVRTHLPPLEAFIAHSLSVFDGYAE